MQWRGRTGVGQRGQAEQRQRKRRHRRRDALLTLTGAPGHTAAADPPPTLYVTGLQIPCRRQPPLCSVRVRAAQHRRSRYSLRCCGGDPSGASWFVRPTPQSGHSLRSEPRWPATASASPGAAPPPSCACRGLCARAASPPSGWRAWRCSPTSTSSTCRRRQCRCCGALRRTPGRAARCWWTWRTRGSAPTSVCSPTAGRPRCSMSTHPGVRMLNPSAAAASPSVPACAGDARPAAAFVPDPAYDTQPVVSRAPEPS
jgi:hypothetical protein